MPKAKRIDVHSHVLPKEMLDALPGLTDEQRERILGLNSLGLLGES